MQKASIVFVMVACSAHSQMIIESNVATFASTQIRSATPTGPLRRELDRGQAAALPAPPSLRWRSTELRPRISYGYVHGDGILANPADLRTTDINTYTIGFALKQGSHWRADYARSRSVYSNSGFTDTSAHSASVAALTTYRFWDLKASQSYLSESLPNVDTAQQTRQETHATALSASTFLNSRFALKSVITQELHFPDRYSTTREWHGQEWIEYKFADRLELSAGVHAGYVSIVRADDMQFGRPQIRIRWRISSAVICDCAGGMEYRKLFGHPPNYLHNAIYSASAKYNYSNTTSLLISGSRDMSVSYFFHQATVNSTFTADLRQRILQHFYLSAGIGTQRAHYVLFHEPSLNVLPRDDKRKYFEVKLSTAIRTRLTLLLFSRQSKNNTNREGYGFASNQSGLEIAYTY